jgi:transposase InsO family protein
VRVARRTFSTHLEAPSALVDFIEVFYNRRRRHSALKYLSPDSFEKRRFIETLVVA